MKKLDNDKHSFDKKSLVKLAPAAVVIVAVAAAGVQTKGEITNTAAEAKSIVKSQDITSLLNTAYFSEETEAGETKEDSGTTARSTSKSKSIKKKSSSKKTTKTSKKKAGGIKKGSVKTLPTKTAAASGQGQGTTTTPTTEVPEGGYKDGVYQGSGTGFGGTITVQVTVSGGQITAVDILSAAGETGSYFSSARGVVSEVLSSQSPNVDAISGATYSSNGIIQAVQNALSQAGSAGSTEVTPTPTPSPKPTKTPKPGKTDKNVTYKDGVYEGAAEGFDGTVTVKVTIKKGKIKKITNTNTDTAEFFNKAWKSIKAEVISRQSVSGIDTVSGATFSSNGILGAVSQALAKAQESGNKTDGTNNGNNSSDPENTVTPIPTQIPGSNENPGDSHDPSDTPQTPENPSEPGSLLKDGVYTASAQGYSGDVVITITVKDGKITEISNTNTDTRTFFNKAWRRLQPKILEKQSAEGIDTVSGATFSSQGILTASKLAIEQAKKNEEPTPTMTPEATPTPVPTKTPEATPTITPEPTKTPEETPTPEPTKTPEPTETPEPTKAPEETPTPEPTKAPASEYKDGTYTGIGEGNDGPDSVQVTITIQDGKITNAVYSTYDDEDFFEPAWEGILSQVMGKQSAEGIDTVSGSTYSSLGIIKAFQEALKQAKGV